MADAQPQTTVGKVQWAFAMSLDGFVAGPGHTMDFQARATNPDGMLEDYIESTGAVLAGRDGYDSAVSVNPYGGAWKGPIFVLTHHPEDARPREDVTFLNTTVQEAVRIGLEAGRGKNLQVHSPKIGRQLLPLGLIDEIEIHVVPVLLGDGVRLYDVPGGKLVHLNRQGTEPRLVASLRYHPIRP